MPAILATGCVGEPEDSKRSTDNSSDLSGLWRMNITSSEPPLNATANSSFLLADTSSGLFMTSCNDRNRFAVTRTGNSIQGTPVGTMQVIDNDTLQAASSYGDVTSSKMSIAQRFDMGNLKIQGVGFGNLTFTNICIDSTQARALGVTTLESFSATVIYNGEPMLFEISVPGNINSVTYDIVREPSNGEAGVRLISDGLLGAFNRREMTLRDGTLNISEDSSVWLKGSFSANMPNGNQASGSFEFEKP
ncbi:MAG: hypothetical protein MI976_26215 [Pseudomonadales bacterium]|nr:hypothetical protein [Pseudomonadales bacterium]